MAHSRTRYLQKPFQELIHFSPLVGVLGHRQVGKTTFLEANCSHYLTFDDQDTLISAQKDAKTFIDGLIKKNTAIDESQLVPGIFPALKERVRTHKQPGQFILSGSVRFTSKKEIRESLTGRIQYLELLPFSVNELAHEPLSQKISQMMKSKRIEDLAENLDCSKAILNAKNKLIEEYRVKGGLPGVCFIRKENLRNAKILDQLKTILDRDLRQVYHSKLTYHEIFALLREVALNEGEPYSYQNMKRKIGLSPVTQKNLLAAFESIFLIRRIEIEGDRRAHSYILEDQGESHFITEGELGFGQQYISMLYRNLRCEYFYRVGSSIKAFQYRNRSKTVIPLVMKESDSYLGFIFSENGSVDRKMTGSAGSFLKRYPNSKILMVHPGSEMKVVNHRTLLCPISALI